MVEDDFVRSAVAPSGQQFAIVVTPPGTARDDRSVSAAGLIGLLLRVIKAGRQVQSDRWWVVVEKRSRRGRPREAVHRSSFSTREDAHARVQALAQLIESGESIA